MKNSNAIRKWKSLAFCLALFAGLFIGSCSDDDNDIPSGTTTAKVPYVCTTCPSSSEAQFGNDNSENGIYKGVFSGGTIEIDFRNNQEKITAKVFYKNKTIEMDESPEIILVEGRRYRAFLRGTGANSNVSLTFLVNDDGSSPEVMNFILSGERSPVPCTIFKERSKMLIEAFEGNYYRVTNTSSPTGPTVPDTGTDRVDPGLGVPANAINAGSMRLILSRSEGMWVMFSTMVSSNGDSTADHGNLVDGSLISDVTGKKIAQLTADELNHNEYVGSGAMYLYAQRKR